MQPKKFVIAPQQIQPSSRDQALRLTDFYRFLKVLLMFCAHNLAIIAI